MLQNVDPPPAGVTYDPVTLGVAGQYYIARSAIRDGEGDCRGGLMWVSICARTKAPKSGVEGALQGTDLLEEKWPLATLPRGVHLRRLFRGFFHAAFRHCAEQNSCSVLFLQNSFLHRLHLVSTFFSISLPQSLRKKGQEVSLRARLVVI